MYIHIQYSAKSGGGGRQKLQRKIARNRVWTRVEQVAMFAANGLGKMYIAQGGEFVFFFVSSSEV